MGSAVCFASTKAFVEMARLFFHPTRCELLAMWFMMSLESMVGTNIHLFEGPTIPLIYRNGLLHMKTAKPTHEELQSLPVHDLTIDMPWQPTNEYDDDDDDGFAPSDLRQTHVNAFASKLIMLSDDAELRDDIIAETQAGCQDTYSTWIARLNNLSTNVKNLDWEKLIPCFAWKPQKVIEKTLQNTTQYYRTTSGRLPMRQYFKSRTPALRVPRLNETWSVDWIDRSVPSINGGFTGFHLFCGKTSKQLIPYGGHGPSDFPDHLTQFIADKGAPTLLMSDNATAETSKAANKICREMRIKRHTSEPHKQNQNPVERSVQDVKRDTVKSWTALEPLTHCGFML